MRYALVFAGLPGNSSSLASQDYAYRWRGGIGRRNAHDQQQELFLMGASRLVDDQIFGASFL